MMIRTFLADLNEGLTLVTSFEPRFDSLPLRKRSPKVGEGFHSATHQLQSMADYRWLSLVFVQMTVPSHGKHREHWGPISNERDLAGQHGNAFSHIPHFVVGRSPEHPNLNKLGLQPAPMRLAPDGNVVIWVNSAESQSLSDNEVDKGLTVRGIREVLVVRILLGEGIRQ